MFQTFIKSNWQHLVVILGFVIVSSIYFLPQIQGDVIAQADITAFNGMASETTAYYAKYGKKTLWTNSMFSGMPTYQIGGIQHRNVFRYLEVFGRLGLNRPIGYFVFGAISAYILFLVMGLGPWLSMAGGLAFCFSTSNIILFEAGHNTKLFVIMGAPLIFAGLLSVLKRKYIMGLLILTLGIGLNVYKNHFQMTYYIALFFGIFMLIELIKIIREKDFDHLKKVILTILASVILGIGPSATKLMTTYEYVQESIRGAPILSKDDAWTGRDTSLHSQWQYNMQFSHGLRDLKSLLVPGAAGGSSAERIRKNSPMAQEYNRAGYKWEASGTELYWGSLPFSSGTPYLGIVMLFLAMVGILVLKGTTRWWVLGSLLFAAALSMGRHLEWFNRFFFEYLPLYKAFRSPNSVMSLAICFAPILALPTIRYFMDHREEEGLFRKVLIMAGAFGALLVAFYFASPSTEALTMKADVNMEQLGMDSRVLRTERVDFMRSDTLRSLVFVALAVGLLFAYLRYRFKSAFFIAGIGLLLLSDFWLVDRRYIWDETFETPSEVAQIVEPSAADLRIMADPDIHFRVLDQTTNTFNSSKASYHHKSIGGYHAAKLRRYEDVIELHIKKLNTKVINMLNAKYILHNDENGEPVAGGNREILGNVWYVENIRWVETPDEEINALNYFNPETDAVIHEEFREYLEGMVPVREGAIDLIRYEPNHLTYESEGNGERFAVFSEIYYGPNKGWKVYIDGEEHDHIRVNYLLRGLRIPAGDHRIDFVFDPDLYTYGEWISTLFSFCFLSLLGFLGYQRVQEYRSQPPPPSRSAPRKKKAASATSGTKKTARKKVKKKKKDTP